MKRVLTFLVIIQILALGTAYAIAPPKSGKIPKHLLPYFEQLSKEYNQGYWAEQMQRRAAMRATFGKSAQLMKIDTAFLPVLLGKYSNSTNYHSQAAFQAHLFDGPNPTGTLTQYYMEISYDQYYLTGQALGWFKCARTFDYYVHDGGDRNVGLVYGGKDFTIDLLVVADETVDFSKFVKYTDSEGAHVPILNIVHTGADAASGADNIWSHRSSIRNRLLTRKNSGTETIVDVSRILSNGHYRTNDTYNGLSVIIDGDYAIQPEMEGSVNTGGALKPIGVFAHEYGHVLGLPDLYDRTNKSEGVGNWCLMASGSYGGDSRHEGTPAHMSAWCKIRLGWVTPTTVTTYLKQKAIKQVETNPEIYKIEVRGTSGGQYFLVENRQQKKFDSYLFTSGLAIWHVDPSVTTQNDVPDHYLVDIEQADGLRNLNVGTGNRGDAGDLYPGSSNNRTFDGFSRPDSRDYNLQQSYVAVTKISNSDSVMYADLDVGTRPYIRVNSIALIETGTHNNNGRVDPGETGNINVNLSNIFPVALNNGTISVASATSDVTVDTTTRLISIGSLATTSTTLNSVITFKPNGTAQTTTFTVNVTTPDETFIRTFEAVLGYPALVLVDIDSLAVDNIASKYRTVLDTKGEKYEFVKHQDQTLSNMKLSNRSIIVWYTGRKTYQTIPDSLADSLKAFVTNGGKLFLTGQNIAEDLTKRQSTLTADVLHATWKTNVAFGRTLYGIPEDYLGKQIPKLTASGGNSAGNQTSPDILDVDTSKARPTFRWNSPTGTNYGGVWWENSAKGTKVVFWSFGMEAINDSAQGCSTREQALTAVLNWFRGISSTPELLADAEIPRTPRLYNNYPNPFNPTTTISYQFSVVSDVSLKVFDLLGREVATLAEGTKKPGVYTTKWDASNHPSGVYFCQLQVGEYKQIRKMLLLR